MQRNVGFRERVAAVESAKAFQGKWQEGKRDASVFVWADPLSNKKPNAGQANSTAWNSGTAWSIAAAFAIKIQQASIFTWFCIVLFVSGLIWLVYTGRKFAKVQRPVNQFSRDFYNADPEGKLYVYASEHLLTWSVLLTRTFFVIFSWRVWIVVPCVFSVALAVAALIIYGVPYANKLDTARMETVAEYLRIFIVFKLGLYMNTSLQRWWAAVVCFKTTLTTVKELVWTAHVMHLRMQIIHALQRKCILACYILEAEMHTGLGVEAEETVEYWNETFEYLSAESLLSAEEAVSLRTEHCEKHLGKHHGDRSTLVWAWIGRTVGRISEEPGVIAPMCVRLVSLCHTAMNKTEELKIHGAVQVPFSYAYLLAVLVHLNNILLAVSSGIFIAQGLDRVRKGRAEAAHSDTTVQSEKAESGVYADFEVLWTQIFLLVFQPLMYQAFLGIAHVLNHPFGGNAFHLPSKTYIRLCREELDVMTAGYANSPDGMSCEAMRSRGLNQNETVDAEAIVGEDEEGEGDGDGDEG